MSRSARVATFAILACLGAPARGETLDAALQDVARRAARILRSDDLESAALASVLEPPNGYLINRFRLALVGEGIEVEANGENGGRIGLSLWERGTARGVDVRILNGSGRKLGAWTRELRLDDATDRAVLDGLTFDATASGTATRLAVLQALVDETPPHIAESPKAESRDRDRPEIVVRTTREGFVEVVIDGGRIVVRVPERPPEPDDSERWSRHRRYERR